MSRYTSATETDRQEMLDAIGVESIDDLFADVPEGVRLGRPLDLPPGKPEQEVYARLRDLAAKNASAEDEISFLGAGMYDHYVPALIDSILSRSEFLTPYTPYQPEICQGGLQVMFEYQTAICELTGLPVSNASVYEGPSAVAAAGWLAHTHTKKTKFLVSEGLHPHSRETLETTPPAGARRSRRSRSSNGLTELGEVGDDVAAIFVGQPNFYGAIEDIGRAVGAQGRRAADRPGRPAHARRAALAGRLRRGHLRRRGPDARQPPRLRRPVLRLLRRPAGATCAACRAGSPARRPTSTAAAASCSPCRRASSTSAARRPPSNICTAQALNALAGVIYLSWLGREGSSSWASCSCRARTTPARRSPRSTASSSGTTSPSCASSRSARCRTSTRCSSSAPSAASTRATRSRDNGLLVAITEQRSQGRHRPPRRGARTSRGRAACFGSESLRTGRDDTETAARRPGDRGATSCIRSAARSSRPTCSATARRRSTRSPSPAGARSWRPSSTCPSTSCPAQFRRAEPPKLPEIAEPEIVRHYNRLSKRNFDLDSGFYPLGSCTMKHNPKLHERVAALPGNARLHPLQYPKRAQGALELMYDAAGVRWPRSPACRTCRCSRPPARTASSPACCVTRAYHEDRGDHRTKSSPRTPRTAPTRRR